MAEGKWCGDYGTDGAVIQEYYFNSKLLRVARKTVVEFQGKIAYNILRYDIYQFLLLESMVGWKIKYFSGIGKGCDGDEQYFKYGKPILQSNCERK